MPRTPDTIIQFFYVPWDMGYTNLRYFSSESSRDSWFSGHTHRTYPDDFLSTVDHAQPVKEGIPYTVRGNWDYWHNYNYIRYKNTGYDSGEWIYCFITGWSYASEHSATFSFVRDIWVNNVGKFTFPKMYVERETTDTVTDLPEPYTVHRYVSGEPHTIHDGSHSVDSLLYVVLASGGSAAADHDQYSCTISGVQYQFRLGTFDNPSLMNVWLQNYQTNGTIDRIVAVFALPRALYTVGQNSLTGSSLSYHCDNDYTPTVRNEKCLRYPYQYLEIGDWYGNKQAYKWENGYSDGSGQHFMVEQLSVASMSSFVTLCPSDLQNTSKQSGVQSISHSVHGTMGYTADGMTGWIAQNTTQIKAQQEQLILQTGAKILGGTVGAIGAGLATGGAGAVAVGLSTATSVGVDIASFEISQNAMLDRADYTPNSVGMPDGAVLGLISQGRGLFYYRTVHMSESELRSLDDYFTRFGYNVSRYKTLNLSRSPYYFVKTGGAVVRGNCPQSDRDAMIKILNRGVTFWSTDDIGNYDL